MQGGAWTSRVRDARTNRSVGIYYLYFIVINMNMIYETQLCRGAPFTKAAGFPMLFRYVPSQD
jgi:hypothetical protein